MIIESSTPYPLNQARILLCDDDQLLLDLLSLAITKWDWVDEVNVSATREDAIKLLSALQYDILLLDMRMPGHNGIEIAKEVHWMYPMTKIIMLTGHAGDALILNMYKAGIHGFALKDFLKLNELEKIVRRVLCGERCFPPTINDVIERNNISTKTPEMNIAPRHKQVLELLLKGKDTKQIADVLHLSVNTVNSYKSELMKQTNSQSTPELIAFIRINGLH